MRNRRKLTHGVVILLKEYRGGDDGNKERKERWRERGGEEERERGRERVNSFGGQPGDLGSEEVTRMQVEGR